MSTLLYNCESFGHLLPDGLEEIYFKMIKAGFGVRPSTPNNIALIEAGFLPIKAIILARQFNFFKRFNVSLHADSTRKKIFHDLLEGSKYINHYVSLDEKYGNCREIYEEYSTRLKNEMQKKNDIDLHYKHWIYIQINPTLTPSPFLTVMGRLAQSIIKFRTGSHNLPIEKGRWSRTPRANRLCAKCNVIGDEKHLLHDCVDIRRDDLLDIPMTLEGIWKYKDLFKLFGRIVDQEYVD